MENIDNPIPHLLAYISTTLQPNKICLILILTFTSNIYLLEHGVCIYTPLCRRHLNILEFQFLPLLRSTRPSWIPPTIQHHPSSPSPRIPISTSISREHCRHLHLLGFRLPYPPSLWVHLPSTSKLIYFIHVWKLVV